MLEEVERSAMPCWVWCFFCEEKQMIEVKYNCPLCGNFLTMAKYDNEIHQKLCWKCYRVVYFRVKSGWYGIKKVPERKQSSGIRFY